TWFSVSIGVLAVPPAGPALAQLLDDLWPHVEPITSREVLEYAITTNTALRDLAGHPVDDIWAEVSVRRAGRRPAVDEDEDLLAPEWAQLSNPAHAINGPDFRLREVGPPPSFKEVIERVVLAERLR